MLFAIGRGDLDVAERFEDAERERGRTFAAAGERDDDKKLSNWSRRQVRGPARSAGRFP
jgi:hypothetical protein